MIRSSVHQELTVQVSVGPKTLMTVLSAQQVHGVQEVLQAQPVLQALTVLSAQSGAMSMAVHTAKTRPDRRLTSRQAAQTAHLVSGAERAPRRLISAQPPTRTVHRALLFLRTALMVNTLTRPTMRAVPAPQVATVSVTVTRLSALKGTILLEVLSRIALLTSQERQFPLTVSALEVMQHLDFGP